MIRTIGHGVCDEAVKESGEEEIEVEVEVAGQPCPTPYAENVSKVATVGDEHVTSEILPEGVPESADSIGFGNGAVKGWPILYHRTVSVQAFAGLEVAERLPLVDLLPRGPRWSRPGGKDSSWSRLDEPYRYRPARSHEATF